MLDLRSGKPTSCSRDGSVGHVRPITPDDADRLRSFHSGQSDESIYLRFSAPIRELSDRDATGSPMWTMSTGSPSS